MGISSLELIEEEAMTYAPCGLEMASGDGVVLGLKGGGEGCRWAGAGKGRGFLHFEKLITVLVTILVFVPFTSMFKLKY